MVKNMPEAEIISEYIFAYEYLQNTNLGNLDFLGSKRNLGKQIFKEVCMYVCMLLLWFFF